MDTLNNRDLKRLPPPPPNATPVGNQRIPVSEMRKRAKSIVNLVRDVVILRKGIVQQFISEIHHIPTNGSLSRKPIFVLECGWATIESLGPLWKNGIKTVADVTKEDPIVLASIANLPMSWGRLLFNRANDFASVKNALYFSEGSDVINRDYKEALQLGRKILLTEQDYYALNKMGEFIERLEDVAVDKTLEFQSELIDIYENPTWFSVEEKVERILAVLMDESISLENLWGDYRSRPELYEGLVLFYVHDGESPQEDEKINSDIVEDDICEDFVTDSGLDYEDKQGEMETDWQSDVDSYTILLETELDDKTQEDLPTTEERNDTESNPQDHDGHTESKSEDLSDEEFDLPIDLKELVSEESKQTWREILEEVDVTKGGLPAELEASIEDFPLNLDMLNNITLRGYQAFGAKFALHQKRVIIGDAMGLGKTIEAITVMAHMATENANRFLVVCPASVITNWKSEIERFSKLKAEVMHDSRRDEVYEEWIDKGGIAITTYDTLKNFPLDLDSLPDLVVVDEAHLIKNKRTARAWAVAEWTQEVENVILLTGTPIENKVEEFRSLVSFVNRDIANKTMDFEDVEQGKDFAETIAAIYLRRSQKDVLQELPEKIETDVWLPMKQEEKESYRRAVHSGNFMSMRRASFAVAEPHQSAKIERLKIITEESISQGRKVVVFSYSLDNLEIIEKLFPTYSMPSICGRVPPSRRQQIIDTFTNQKQPAVLPAQIESGGIGLNIQAASVVIICEPQWKPSTEDQAIARAYRMGQKNTVNVYRLLSEESVDVYIRNILTKKRELVDSYIPSEVTKMFKGALDITEFENEEKSFSRIVEMEQERLFEQSP